METEYMLKKVVKQIIDCDTMVLKEKDTNNMINKKRTMKICSKSYERLCNDNLKYYSQRSSACINKYKNSEIEHVIY